MKDLGYRIYMKIILNDNMSMSEMIDNFSYVSERTVMRAVNDLINTGQIEHKKIHGEGKRKRYTVKEENTKQDITIRAFDEEDIKAKIYEPIRGSVDQRHFSALITESIQFYRKEFNKIKNNPDAHYYQYHISLIGECLEWNTKLTMAIHSGMLGNSPNKLALAYRNKERYEGFLQTLIYNLKRHDEKLASKIVRAIYNRLEDMWFLEKINLD